MNNFTYLKSQNMEDFAEYLAALSKQDKHKIYDWLNDECVIDSSQVSPNFQIIEAIEEYRDLMLTEIVKSYAEGETDIIMVDGRKYISANSLAKNIRKHAKTKINSLK